MELRNNQKRIRISGRLLRKEAQRALEALELGDRTLSVLLTDDPHMALLHQQWMGEEGPTDVMSFPLTDAAAPALLGDVVISVETAARRKPRNVLGEVRRYLIHGILHLAGYHHRTALQRRQMDRLTQRLLRCIL